MTAITKSVRVVGTIGAWAAAIVAGFATFLFVGAVVIGAGSMNLGRVALLLVVTLVAGRITYGAVLGWVGRRAVLVREQERLTAEALERDLEARAAEARRKAEWDADEPRRKAAWDADEPRRKAAWDAAKPARDAARKAAEEEAAKDAAIRKEMERKARIEREVNEAEDARRAALQRAQYEQQVAANNQAAAYRQQWYVNRLSELRNTAAHATWLPDDLRALLKLRATSTPPNEGWIDYLGVVTTGVQQLEPALRNARNAAERDLVIAEIRRLLA